jgi:ammonium transporter, Amt family
LLRNHIQNQGHIARFGGDEFVVLFEHMPFDQVHAICKTLCQIIDDFRFGESGQVFDVTASLGLVYIDYQVTSEEVLARADSACYDAKKKGKNRLVVYQPQDSELKQLVDDSNWASRIRQALRQQQFEVWLQPIRNIKTREAEHYEALVRLRDPSGTYITPASFIPPAERFGIMPSLDRHILAQTVQLMNRHRDLKLSINLSGTSLVDSDLPDYIDEIFSKHHVQPRRVMFEITETAYITNMLKAQELLSYLRDQGFRFALDDFGCGFSSLAYLRNLNVDYIKIDGSFVRNLEHDRLNQTLIKSINEVAHLLQKKTVAEFVEDEASLKILEQIGVDYVQGNYLGQPAPYPG